MLITFMGVKLPTHGFKWMSSGELETLFEQQELNTWNKTPCILEVDLEYPKKLHDWIMIIHYVQRGLNVKIMLRS